MLFMLSQNPPTLNAQDMTIPEGATCDPKTGLCMPTPLDEAMSNIAMDANTEIIYVGDPMCSWCWGISPALNHLQRTAALNGIGYRIVLGGLRPDDSEEWTPKFQDFLRHHWEDVSSRSGQPFNYDLLSAEHFQYNTEPSCRGVVTARTIDPSVEARFFELVQHRFYVLNKDPSKVEFYKPICFEAGIDYAKFSVLFDTEEMKRATHEDFQLNRQWGVRGYPTVIVRTGDKLQVIATGYASFEDMWSRVEQVVAQ
jgi:putative protein-disulfide isomerase